MKYILTPAKKAQMERYDAIARRYKELMSDGSQSSAVVKVISDEMGVCVTMIYKVIRMKKLNRPKIDRPSLINHYEQCLADGMTPAKARLDTAVKFKCSKVYVYQLTQMI